ncbi:MAG: hypothetical protein ACK5TZ_01080, partial [bacterium]
MNNRNRQWLLALLLLIGMAANISAQERKAEARPDDGRPKVQETKVQEKPGPKPGRGVLQIPAVGEV